jgi:hypothetical protein
MKATGKSGQRPRARAKGRTKLQAATSALGLHIDTVDHAHSRAARTVRFGSVTVSNNEPDASVIAANVKAGRDALQRARTVLMQPGVRIDRRPGVPRFSVDAKNPSVLIRDLDGRIERGRIEKDGTFLAVE